MVARILKFIIGLYLGIAGAFMLILLAVDFIDPEWAEKAKATNPLGTESIPAWFYLVAIIVTAGCLGFAWKLIRASLARSKPETEL